ncbi:MAG: hypothetical protein IJT77_14375, partial [Clostridia bacterium]|nr:hypothetical protein [Clostridia bacterium]
MGTDTRQKSLGNNRTALISKLILAFAFVLGLAIIALGYAGIRQYNTSGFSSETAYHAIHLLGSETATAYTKISSQTAAMSEEERSRLDDIARTL